MQLKNVLRAAETELHWVLDSARHNWLRDPVWSDLLSCEQTSHDLGLVILISIGQLHEN